MSHRVLCGDSLAILPTLDAESVDAIVCDPPYGLSFMGKEWDHGVPGEPFWREALRVAKPGAHLVAFGGARTFHRLTCAIEDAGWEIRDCLSWLYGSGFPKSHDVSKAMDKAAGAERTEIIGTRSRNVKPFDDENGWNANNTSGTHNYTAPATDLAREWRGWGTALKPAWEPIILARKPLIGTVAVNVTAHGTGALNVDATRIGATVETWPKTRQRPVDGVNCYTRKMQGDDVGVTVSAGDAPSGRWPANVCLDEEAAQALDVMTGERKGMAVADLRRGATTGKGLGYNSTSPQMAGIVGYGDSGGASRFFYTAKASRREREAGLEGMPEKRGASTSNGGVEGRLMTVGAASLKGEPVEPPTSRNHHPTVKPIALMRWLCRLVTPKGGLILDPFTGSGTTGCAAVLEGFRFVGVEREDDYAAIAEKRIAHWAAQAPSADLFGDAA